MDLELLTETTDEMGEWLDNKRRARDEAQERLRAILRPGGTIHAIRVRISPDGRYAEFRIDATIPPTRGFQDITHIVGPATGFRLTKNGYLGYGGDTVGAPAHIARRLGERLWGNPDALKVVRYE